MTHGTVSELYQDCPNEECYITTRVSFSCDPEYHLSGNEQVTCIGYGEWDQFIPICEGKLRSIDLVELYCINMLFARPEIKIINAGHM